MPTAPNATQAFGINNSGAAVGRYKDADNNQFFGFLRAPDGAITTITMTHKHDVTPSAINDAGTITGGVHDSRLGAWHGFVRAVDGTIATFDAASDKQYTWPAAINVKGAIAGEAVDANRYRGFVRSTKGRIKMFDAPGAGASSGIRGTHARAINAHGVIAGVVIGNDEVSHGFIRASDGSFTIVDGPCTSTKSTTGATLTAINASGISAGWCRGDDNVQHAFVRDADGTLHAFDIEGMQEVLPMAINRNGTVVGGTFNNEAASPAFIRRTSGTITTMEAPDAGGEYAQGTTARAINDHGDIAGDYIPTNTWQAFILTK